MKTMQKFASIHANVRDHFNFERNLVDRQIFWKRRCAALASGVIWPHEHRSVWASSRPQETSCSYADSSSGR
ncbi:MAG: hypothetical protein ABIW33_09360 [Sphingomicrobium sp.]